MSHGRKKHGSSFDVTVGSYDGTELCELIGIYIQSLLESTLKRDLMGLYRDDGLIIFCNTNSQQTNKIQKNIISIFKSILCFNTTSQITLFSCECFLRHYGGQLQTA